MLRSPRLVVLGVVALACVARSQERVGVLGARSRIDLEGVAAFDPQSILGVVFSAHDTLQRVDPSAPLAPYVDWLRARITAGYRFAGYRDAVVVVEPDGDHARLRVRVDERTPAIAAAPRVVMTPTDPDVRAAVEHALTDDGAAFGPLWREGGPARFGDAASDAIRSAVLTACREHAAVTAAVELRHVALEDGRVELEVTLRDAQPRPIASIRFDGIDALEAERLRTRIGFGAGTDARADALAELERSVTDVGRYRDVVVEPPRPGRGPINPLVVRLTPIIWAPAWDEMPWDEMELIRRAVRELGPRFTAGAHVHLSGQLDESTAVGPIAFSGPVDFRISMSAMQLVVSDLRVSGVPVGDLSASIDGELVLRIGTSALGELLRIGLPDPGPGAGALSYVHIAPSPNNEAGNTTSFGIVFATDLASRVRQMRRNPPMSLGPSAAFDFVLHGASVLAMIEHHRAPERGDPGELVLGFEAGDVHIDRQTARARVSTPSDAPQAAIVDEPIPPVEFGTADPDLIARLVQQFAPASSDDAYDAAQLTALTLRQLANVELPVASAAGTERRRFHVPNQHDADGTQLVSVWLQDLGRRVADGYPAGSWPHVFARDLPWMMLDPRGSWPRFAVELDRLQRADACGPIGWGIAMLVMQAHDVEALVPGFALLARRTCTFDRLWRDIEALGAQHSWTGRTLRSLGAAWRADSAALSPETSAALEAAEDDLAALRIGLRVLWNAGLGDALRAEFRRRS